MQRIFISGIGVVSCLGNDRRTFWNNIINSQCGIDRLALHDTKDLEVHIGGEVRDLNEDRINVNDLVSTRKMADKRTFASQPVHDSDVDAQCTSGKHQPCIRCSRNLLHNQQRVLIVGALHD